MRFPEYRPRRLRKTDALRNMVRETSLEISDFIFPLFVVEGKGIKNAVGSLPGQFQYSRDILVREVQAVVNSGVPAVILFGIPSEKDAVGSQAFAQNGVTQQTVKTLKDAFPELVVITDVCLCEYTDHGHCGIISNGDVENDSTLEILAKVALSHVQAGADMVAPSDMMDGRVEAIRGILDESGYSSIPIMAYSAKYCSAFYGPFRDAAQSAPQFGDRKSYQMDPANSDEAIREVELDIDEGADIVMVKPALSYLDIIWRVRTSFNRPVAAYNVSGEYSMVKAAAQNNWIDGQRCMLEILTSIKRAGADLIITYHALEAAQAINSL
ncbi:MAG: porphobilinogen synthase [Desulfomonilaceae bacterium]